MVEDPVIAVGGRCRLPVEVEGQYCAGLRVFGSHVIADEANRAEPAGGFVLDGAQAQHDHGDPAIMRLMLPAFQARGLAQIIEGVILG